MNGEYEIKGDNFIIKDLSTYLVYVYYVGNRFKCPKNEH